MCCNAIVVRAFDLRGFNPGRSTVESRSQQTTYVSTSSIIWYSPNSTWLDSTRSMCRAHAFWLCRRCRTAHLDSRLWSESIDSLDKVELDWLDSQLSLLCNFYKVMITVIHLLFNVSYSLIYWFYNYLLYFI